MLKPMDFYKAQLQSGLKPEQDKLILTPHAVRKLDKVGVGNHTYFSITYGGFQEVLRYDHTENFKDKAQKNMITVTRDIRATGRKTYPCGACITYQWFDQSLREFCPEE